MKLMQNPCEVMPVTPSLAFHSNDPCWQWENYPRLHLGDTKLKGKKMKVLVNGVIEKEEPDSPAELIDPHPHSQI
jgi:hypothetical protein